MSLSLQKVSSKLALSLIDYHTSRELAHLGSSLSCLDILVALFWGPLRTQDSFTLSKGHAVSSLYLILYEKGLLSQDDLHNSCRDGSPLTAHPPFTNKKKHPWFGFGSGSLGYGLGLACGKALAYRLQGVSSLVYVLLSEGDLNEGSTWEALNFAVTHRLNNLCVLLDRNFHQALGYTEDIFPLNHLSDTLRSLGWNVVEQEGHDVENIHFPNSPQLPTFIIFKTRKDKGIEQYLSPLETHYKWPTQSKAGSAK